MTYPRHTDGAVPSSPRFPELEERVLEFWEQDGTFQASIDQRDAGEDGANEFVFYDGPPFANGLPHYGHLLTGYVKDVVPRYQTMRGRRVERRFGWDTHGLPAELEAMRLNGIKTTDEILELGIEKFNEACRASVMKYTDEWRDYVTRQARWVDFDHDYRTYEPDYMESVMWAFKQLYDKGYVYEGFRVLPYCWNDETPLSNHELRMDDDVYQMRQDPAVTVGFRITCDGPLRDALLLTWTTTPWTLPSNLAVMVGSGRSTTSWSSTTGTRLLLAEARLPAYARELGDEPDVVWRGTGADLLGLTYAPPFSYFAGHENAFRVVRADEFVTTTDGTGLVHSAGAFGEADKEVTDREGIEAVMPVGKDGRFTEPVSDYAGMNVFDANLQIIDHLKAGTGERHPGHRPAAPRDLRPLLPALLALPRAADLQGRLVLVRPGDRVQGADARAQPADQLGARAHPGRLVRQVAGERPRLVDHPQPVLGLARPGVAQRRRGLPADRRLRLLRGARARLRQAAAQQGRRARPAPALRRRPDPPEPRRPAPGSRRCAGSPTSSTSGSTPGRCRSPRCTCRSRTRSGSSTTSPPTSSSSTSGQTRGWFYTLHILATGVFDRPAFQNCISHGYVLGSDGNKMSKSLRNYPDVREVFDRDGADAMRWFLMASPILRGGTLIVDRAGHPRRRADRDDPAVEQLVLLPALRQRLARYEAKASTGVDRPARPLPAGQVPAVRRADDDADGRVRRSRTRATRRATFIDVLTQLVHPPVARPVLGGRPAGLRHALHGARDGLPGHRAAAAADDRGDLARPDGRTARCT